VRFRRPSPRAPERDATPHRTHTGGRAHIVANPIFSVLEALRSILLWLTFSDLRRRLALYEDAEGRPRLLYVGGLIDSCGKCETQLVEAKVSDEGLITLYLASRNLRYASGQPQWDEQDLTKEEEGSLAAFSRSYDVYGGWCPKCRRFYPELEPIQPRPGH